jgi:hypothetical protein
LSRRCTIASVSEVTTEPPLQGVVLSHSESSLLASTTTTKATTVPKQASTTITIEDIALPEQASIKAEAAALPQQALFLTAAVHQLTNE